MQIRSRIVPIAVMSAIGTSAGLAAGAAPADAAAATGQVAQHQVSSTTPAPAMLSSVSVSTFIVQNTGVVLANQQGAYAGECVSAISQYLGQVYGITTGHWGNAIDYQQGGSGGAQMSANGFTWSTSQSFANGDVVVWRQNSATGVGSYGHIGIWYNGKIYDQNWGGRRYLGAHDFFGGGFVGKWRR